MVGSVCVCVVCVYNRNRQVSANKASSVLPQVQGRRQEKEVNEEGVRDGGGREGRREEEKGGGACSPLIPSNIPFDDRARPKER